MKVNLNHYCRILFIIGLVLSFDFLSAKIHKPSNSKDKIKLNISGKDRTYYKLNDGGIKYKNVGKQYKSGDSIRIGIYSRTIKAPTGKKNRKFGFTIQIDNGKSEKLKYLKSGSKVTSPDRPGWNYTESGIWYIYLPYKEKGYDVKINPLKNNPVVYVRLSSNKVAKEGSYGKVIKTVNKQDRWRIETINKNSVDKKVSYWYPLEGNNQQQYEIVGPKLVRVFSRIEFLNKGSQLDYYLRVQEDGFDLGNYYFSTKKSDKSSVMKTKIPVGKWRSFWLNVPKGKHYYTFSLPDVDNNKKQIIYIRIKEWEKKK
tara:strand:- start:10 stop:948 length:939 start_codon:yes stop_codon:yes gene_type:complete